MGMDGLRSGSKSHSLAVVSHMRRAFYEEDYYNCSRYRQAGCLRRQKLLTVGCVPKPSLSSNPEFESAGHRTAPRAKQGAVEELENLPRQLPLDPKSINLRRER